MANRIYQNTIIKTDTGVSVANSGDTDVYGNHIENARIGVDVRDPTVIEQLGLKSNTPPELIEQLLTIARTPNISAQTVEQEAKKLGFDGWLGRAANLASVASLILQVVS